MRTLIDFAIREEYSRGELPRPEGRGYGDFPLRPSQSYKLNQVGSIQIFRTIDL